MKMVLYYLSAMQRVCVIRGLIIARSIMAGVRLHA